MNKLLSFYKKIYNFIRYDIWKITVGEASKGNRILFDVIKTIYLAAREYTANKLNVRAAALTYSITFAVVPIIALLIAIGKGFGIETYIENALRDTFIAQANMMPKVMSFVEKYLQTTRGGVFIGVGLAILIYAVFNFFKQVENAFNFIWHVKKSRSIIRQFTILFSGLFIFPILIVISSGLSIYINNILSQTILYQFFSPILKFLMFFVPLFLSWLVFTFMYLVIPNTKVKFMNAMIAGIIAGSAFQAFQLLYVSGQINLTRYNAIYGGFAAVPLLLLWINISSLIVLLGAEIAYVSQNLRNYDYETDTQNISNRYKKYLAVFVTFLIVKRFENDQPPLNMEEIIKEYKLPIRLLRQVLQILTESNVITEVYDAELGEKKYLPYMDINKLSINILYSKIDKHGSELFLTNETKEMKSIWKKMLDIQQKVDTIREDILIKDLY